MILPETAESGTGSPHEPSSERSYKFRCHRAVMAGGWAAKLGRVELLTYMAYFDHADAQGITWVGVDTIARYAGHSDNTHIRRARTKLEKMGLLKRLDNRRGGNPDSRESKCIVKLLIPDPAPNQPTLPDEGGLISPRAESARDPGPNLPKHPGLNPPNEVTNRTTREHSAHTLAAADEAVSDLLNIWHEEYEKAYHAPYLVSEDDRQAAAAVIRSIGGDVDQQRRVLRAYLGDREDFFVKARHQLRFLPRQIQRFYVGPPRAATTIANRRFRS